MSLDPKLQALFTATDAHSQAVLDMQALADNDPLRAKALAKVAACAEAVRNAAEEYKTSKEHKK